MASAICRAVVKSGIAQEQRNGLEIVQIHSGVALDNSAVGNGADRGRIDFLAVRAVAGGVTTHNQRSLRFGIYLAIRAVERTQQQHAAFEALGVACRGDRNIQFALPGARKEEAIAVTKTAATFLTSTVPGEMSTPIFCMALARVCTVK